MSLQICWESNTVWTLGYYTWVSLGYPMPNAEEGLSHAPNDPTQLSKDLGTSWAGRNNTAATFMCLDLERAQTLPVMTTLTPFQPPQLIGKYASPMEC